MAIYTKRLIVIAILFSGFILTGCSQSSTSSLTTNPPAISNLVFSPTSSTVGAGGGSITVTAYINFTDEEGDLNFLTLKTAAGETKTTITGADGIKTGTVYCVVIISTATAGNFSFEVWATDKANNTSNHLTGIFPIL